MKKEIVIFGSTGSIGKNTLEVIKQSQDKFRVIGLCANKDINTLYSQIKQFAPKYVCVSDEKEAKKLRKKLNSKTKLFQGKEGLKDFSAVNSDISVMAISGVSSLLPLLINIEHTKTIALANKESIVVAGSLVFDKARKFNTKILPVDSEINALFQLIDTRTGQSNLAKDLRCVYITASGGALAGCQKKNLTRVSVKKVLAHPTWKMGKRITIDSATLVNKGFEVIETHHFFNLPLDKINIVIHKESAVHALVEFKDNALLACLYPPSMRIPISYALSYPNRFSAKSRNIFKNKFSYSFEPIRYNEYPLLKVILQAAKRNDNSLVILNACDEVAIDYFLRKKIRFSDIYKVMQYIFKNYEPCKLKTVDEVLFWDNWARVKTAEYLN